jgi:Erv1 / Alr family
MDAPQNHIWGPNLWTILHSSAERIGTSTVKLPREELRIWTGVLSSLRHSLPCPICKKHFTAYFSATPLKTFNREFIRIWLYNLHCQVNDRTDKKVEISIEDISEIYSKPFNFSAHFRIVVEQMNRALRLGWSSRDDIQKSVRIFEELKRYYDFF